MIDYQNFSTHYKNHLEWLDVELSDKISLEQLYQHYLNVINNGGWARTIGLDNWELISTPRQVYETNHLVSFERRLANNWSINQKLSKNLDYSLLKSVKIKTNIRYDEWDEIYAEDLLIFRDVYKFGISKDLISLKSLKNKHGNENITVIVQESDTSGFSIKKATKQKMRLGKYIRIMEKNAHNDNLIRFAVNIDFGHWKHEIDEMRKFLPGQILWCSDEDALKHLRQHILGMSQPQLYLKISGCWTGGHEENLRFSAANINHGPNDCEWWGLDSTQSLQLRECIKIDRGFEIYNSETLWWPDEIYCISKGLKVYHVIQKPGDLVLVGPGTIHWVKSCGVTTNTAWNFGPKTLNNFKTSFERNWINKAISFKSLVPMHILSMDLLNSELKTLDILLAEYLISEIMFKAEEEHQEFSKSSLIKPELNSNDNIINCEICYAELFQYYYKCSVCIQRRIDGENNFCFFCFECAVNSHKFKCQGDIIPVRKFKKSSLNELMERVQNKCDGKECSGIIYALRLPFSRDEEEKTYVSPYNGNYNIENLVEEEKQTIAVTNDNNKSQVIIEKSNAKKRNEYLVEEKKINDESVEYDSKKIKINNKRPEIADNPPIQLESMDKMIFSIETRSKIKVNTSLHPIESSKDSITVSIKNKINPIPSKRLQSNNIKKSMCKSRNKIDLDEILKQLPNCQNKPKDGIKLDIKKSSNIVLTDKNKSLKEIKIITESDQGNNASLSAKNIKYVVEAEEYINTILPFKRSSEGYHPVLDKIPLKTPKLE